MHVALPVKEVTFAWYKSGKLPWLQMLHELLTPSAHWQTNPCPNNLSKQTLQAVAHPLWCVLVTCVTLFQP